MGSGHIQPKTSVKDLDSASSTLCFAKRCGAVLPLSLARALGPVLHHIADMTVKIKEYDRAMVRDPSAVPVPPPFDYSICCSTMDPTQI
jgi:hypothetical protein